MLNTGVNTTAAQDNQAKCRGGWCWGHRHPKWWQSRTVWQNTNCGGKTSVSWQELGGQLTGHVGFWVPWRHLLQYDWWNCGSVVVHAVPQGLPSFPHPAWLGCCKRVFWGKKQDKQPLSIQPVFSKPVPASHNHLTRDNVYWVDPAWWWNKTAVCKYSHKIPMGQPGWL